MRVLVPVLRQAAEGRGALTAKYPNAQVFAFELFDLAMPEFLRDALRRAGAGGYDPTTIA
jgi:hypothetical protein